MDDPKFSEDMSAYVENVLVPEMEEDNGLLDPSRLEDMKAYVTDVLIPEMEEPDGMLDNESLIEKQKKMQDEMKAFYE